MADFVSAIKQKYTVTGCQQPLYTFFHSIGDNYFFRYGYLFGLSSVDG